MTSLDTSNLLQWKRGPKGNDIYDLPLKGETILVNYGKSYCIGYYFADIFNSDDIRKPNWSDVDWWIPLTSLDLTLPIKVKFKHDI